LSVTFDSHAPAAEVAEALHLAAPTGPVEGWSAAGDGVHAGAVGDRVTVHSGQSGPDVDRRLPARLLEAIPDDAGCAVAVRLRGEAGDLDIALHVPSAEGPVSFGVVGAPVELMAAVAAHPVDAAPVTSLVPPDVVAVLGVGLGDIDFSRFMVGRELRRARAAQALVPIQAGSVVGLIGTPGRPTFAAAIPVAGAVPAPALARRVRALLRGMGLHNRRLDATHIEVPFEHGPLLIAATRGRLYLSTQPIMLFAMERGRGEPWVGDDLAGLASRFPVALSSLLIPMPGGVGPVHLDEPIRLGLDVDAELVRGEIDTPIAGSRLLEMVGRMRAIWDARPRGE
jgi:hypothetical protein